MSRVSIPCCSRVQFSIRLIKVHQFIVWSPHGQGPHGQMLESVPPATTGIPRQLEGQDLKVKSIPLSRSLNIPVSCPCGDHAFLATDLLPSVIDQKAPSHVTQTLLGMCLLSNPFPNNMRGEC